MREPTSSPDIEQVSPQFIDQEKIDLLYYLINAAIIVSLIVLLFLVVGMLQLTVFISILALIGINLVIWIRENTETSKRWGNKRGTEEKVNLKLSDMDDLLKRACRDMEISQHLLERKIEKMFLDRVKEKKDLSDDDVIRLLENPEQFRRIIDDDVISDFILSDGDEDVYSSRGKKNYEKWIADLTERIENWE
ncbi:MAG: hypothetical protein KGY76_07780 [Candidatus Thermoplasmatota archaeon]|nr:hypothetical protein [Candidatus Thermoplasmatota archaeon]